MRHGHGNYFLRFFLRARFNGACGELIIAISIENYRILKSLSGALLIERSCQCRSRRKHTRRECAKGHLSETNGVLARV